MKKSIRYALVALFVFILLPISANAKTLGDLKKEYSALEQQYSSKNSEIKKNESESSAAKSRVESIYGELDEAEKDIQNLNNEITKLNESILQKDAQLKDLMRFFQTSEGESTYLEYIFKAKSITDFIYRLSVTEQLSTYNTRLISEMNSLIKQNNENITKLHEKEESLKALQNELSEKLVVLAKQRESLYEEYESIEDEIKNAKSILEYYTKAGCKDNQDISNCANQQLPASTKFWRPLTHGHVTSEYGYRIHPIYGTKKLHTGIDLSGYDYDVKPVTDGKVAVVVNNGGYNGGMGNYIVIYHNVNGRNYTSVYMHLATAYVSQGTVVTKDTTIGRMGNTGASTATHLHLTMYTGLLYQGSTSMVNPRDYINFPTEHYYKWNDRTSYYK